MGLKPGDLSAPYPRTSGNGGSAATYPALGTFVSEYLALMDRNLTRVEEDVLAFTQTFDSTHSHTLVGNPQGALDRCLMKIAGIFPEYEDEAKSRKGPLMGGVTSS